MIRSSDRACGTERLGTPMAHQPVVTPPISHVPLIADPTYLNPAPRHARSTASASLPLTRPRSPKVPP